MKNKIFKGAVGIAVAVHIVLTMTSYFSSPSSRLKFYTKEILTQSWNFFAPDPGVFTHKVFVQCGEQWIDPVADNLYMANRVPFYIYYARTFLIRTLSQDYVMKLGVTANRMCSSTAPIDKSLYQANQEGQLDFAVQDRTVCPEVSAFMLKTPEYKQLQNLGKMICDGQKAERITLIQKHPFPYSERESAKDKPYYKISAVEL